MASESWSTYTGLQTPHFMPYLRGTLGVAIRRGEIPGLKDFLTKIHPDNDHESNENSIVRFLFHFVFKLQFNTVMSVLQGLFKVIPD